MQQPLPPISTLFANSSNEPVHKKDDPEEEEEDYDEEEEEEADEQNATAASNSTSATGNNNTESRKRKKLKLNFPALKIKRIMQSDSDIGKIAQAVPIMVSKSLELFLKEIVKETVSITKRCKAKTITPSHLKQIIQHGPHKQKYNFMEQFVQHVKVLQMDESAMETTVPETVDVQSSSSSSVEPKKKRKSQSSETKEEKEPKKKKTTPSATTNSVTSTASSTTATTTSQSFLQVPSNVTEALVQESQLIQPQKTHFGLQYDLLEPHPELLQSKVLAPFTPQNQYSFIQHFLCFVSAQQQQQHS